MFFVNLNAFPILRKYTCRWYLTWLWGNRSLESSEECMCQQGHQNVSDPFMLLNVFTLNLSSKWLMTYLLLIWIHFSCYYSAVGFHNWSVLLRITFGWVSFLQDSLAYGGGATIRHFYILMGHLSLTFVINMFTKNVFNISCFPGIV